MDVQDGTGLIVEVLPRHNRLARRDPAPGTHKFEQVIVANVDYVIPIFAAAQPTPKWGLLDRYLASAESLGLIRFDRHHETGSGSRPDMVLLMRRFSRWWMNTGGSVIPSC